MPAGRTRGWKTPVFFGEASQMKTSCKARARAQAELMICKYNSITQRRDFLRFEKGSFKFGRTVVWRERKRPDAPGTAASLLGLERLHGLLVCLPLVLNGFLQEHILHLYGVSGLANANLSQAVPFIKAFSLPASHPFPRLTTYSHRRSGKSAVRPAVFAPLQQVPPMV